MASRKQEEVALLAEDDAEAALLDVEHVEDAPEHKGVDED